MNIYFAWIQPLPELLEANFLFFVPPSRPFGRLFYALAFHFAGLAPMFYHAVCFLFLSANIYLTYCFAQRITGSPSVAAVACLLHAYHGSSAALDYNSGTCFDLFCFFFYFSAFVYYLRIRGAGAYPRPLQILLLVCLYAAALDSKEMAVTLLVLIGVYEALYHRGESWRLQIPTLGAMGLMTAAYILGTAHGDESLTNLLGYKPVISAAAYLAQTQSFLNDLIYSVDWFNSGRTLALLAALSAIARLSRNRGLKFCWLFVTIGVLPIAFIAPRGLYAEYIPMVGLSIFFAIPLVEMARKIVNQPMRVGLFIAAAVVLAAVHRHKGQANVALITAEQQHIQDVAARLRQLHRSVPAGSRILLLKDPFEGRVWDSTFLLRLLYRDNSLVVERQENGKDAQQYDYVWSFEDGGLVEVSATHAVSVRNAGRSAGNLR